MDDQKKFTGKVFLRNLKYGVWLFGIFSWLFGITDRSVASFADGYLSGVDLTQLLTAVIFLAAWLFLKPTSSLITVKEHLPRE